MKLLSAVVTAACVLGFASAVAACPFSSMTKSDDTAETILPKDTKTVGS